jgi:hypothetical protein
MSHGADPLPSSEPGRYPLPAIPYLRLSFVLRALAPVRLPAYKGSMLRGAFGHALRRTVCAMGPQQACETCRLRQACAYARTFETFIEGTPPPFLRGLPCPPRPYVFEPGDDQRDFAPGDPLPFDLVLIGQAADLQPYALLAIERMAAAGLGVHRVPFELAHAEARTLEGGRHILHTNGRATLSAPLPPELPARNGIDPSRATLHLLTPLRIKENGRFASALSFRSLVFAMLRRTLEIAWFHVPTAPIDWTFQSLLDQASAVQMTSTLAWHDWDRYSNRQQAKIPLGGLVGTVKLEGDLAPFAPLLRSAEILHVGKGATLGLGRIAVE